MQSFLEDWRFFLLVYIVGSGMWSVLAKFAAARIDSFTQTFIAVVSSSMIVTAFSYRSLQWQSRMGIAAAAAGGILGGHINARFLSCASASTG